MDSLSAYNKIDKNNSWIKTSLGSIAKYINGYAFKPEDWQEYGIPIIRIEQLKNPDTKYDYCNKKIPEIYIIHKGDLIFSWSASLYLKIWERGDAYLNQHLYKVIPNPITFKFFLKYLIQFNLDKLIKETHGSTMKHITRPSLLGFIVNMPSKIEQKKIAEILETIDEEIEKTDEIIKKYERIKNGLMQDLFSKGITAFQFEKDKLIQAVTKAFENGDHKFGREENLVGHLKDCLHEQFPDWTIDGEVEKNNQRQRPDIIIHKRGTDENLFAIEVKKNGNIDAIKQDIKKLEDVMLGDYHYEDAIFIGFNIKNADKIFDLSDNINFILVLENGEIKTKSRVRKFKDSPLGKIPEEWEVIKLEYLCEKIADRDHTTPKYVDDGIPIVSPKDFDANEIIDFKKCARISLFDHLINRKKTDIKTGDIIFTRIGAGLGKSCLVTKEMPEFSILHSASMIRVNKEMNSIFFLYNLKSFNLQKQITDGIQSIGVPDLGMDKIKNLLIFKPMNISEQCRIAEILSKSDNILLNEQKYKQKLERIKQGLMEDLLTGKVRVNHLIEEDN